MENIMVTDANFKEDAQGNISIDSKISIKLCDFGVSELFDIDTTKMDNTHDQNKNVDTIHNNSNRIDMVRSNPFICSKSGLNIDNASYLSPLQFDEELYDARYADNWSLGMILFESMTSSKLFEPFDVMMNKNGFYALYNDKLRDYLNINNLSKYFNQDSCYLIMDLC